MLIRARTPHPARGANFPINVPINYPITRLSNHPIGVSLWP